ncbi:PASTA domain-containing protein [Caproiciproducens sp.]|uniref:PASTA domain-containing protein n=1 Tax=Caproiciproducens sp. TaxID=1954376 RepID=UPI002896A4FA|nr:PASTA domain-containing protein [Caproiciproducens sp.]
MTGFDNLCMNCMSDTNGKAECSNCGFSSAESQMHHALPYRTRLQKRYIVGRAKKSNGEGITYIGYDTVLNIPIELREFFPQTLCERPGNGADIRVIGGSEIIFDECLAAFLNYSREVAHMRELSAIVQIYDIFEENHTAYTVSEWNESITLRYFVERSGGNLSWNAARQLFMPVLSALSSMQAAGIRHLGISPDTLNIMQDGRMKLGSFCIGAVRRMDTDLPPDLVPGCAAIEQYVMDYVPNESTDVYGFAASLFFALTGTIPQDALKRRTDMRLLIPTSIMRNLPPHVVTAMANALQVSPDKRTPTFERLRAELSAAPTVTATIEETQRIHRTSPEPEEDDGKKGVPNFVWVILTCVAALIVFTIVGIIWISNTDKGDAATLASEASQAESAASDSVNAAMDSVESTDPNLIEAPNLVGQIFQEQAESDASSASQDYQVLLSSKQFSDTIPEGSIISQSPAAGTKMAKGTAIVVVVSEGAAVRTLPPIAGKSLADASETVTSAGFTPTKTEEYSSTVEQGTVIGYKDVKEGSQMAYGSQVVIVVSKGPEQSGAASTAADSAP